MDAQSVRGSLAPMSDETLSFTNGSVLLRWFIVEDLLEGKPDFSVEQILNSYPLHYQGMQASSNILYPLSVRLSLRLACSGCVDSHQRTHRAYCSSECLRLIRVGFCLYSDGIVVCRLTE